MPNLLVHKVTALPGTLEPHSVYFVAPAARPNYVEVYVTNAAGDGSRKIIDQPDIQAMIDAAVAAGSGGTVIVDDIAARDAISADNAQTVYVVDASADATVASGGASYIWRESTTSWIKMSEAESLDLSLTWAAITGGPASTPANIDAAVAARHSHPNMTELGKIGEDGDGNLLYDGSQPLAPWSTNAW